MRLDRKVAVNFKIYDVIDWATNNYNTHITHYLRGSKAIRRINLVWSVTKIQREKYFSSKVMQNMG